MAPGNKIILSIAAIVVVLLLVLYDEGVIQIGGSDFRLDGGDVPLLTEPVLVRGWNQLTQEPKEPIK